MRTMPEAIQMTLKELRKSKKLTQKSLADKSGVSQCYICALEQGRKRSPSVDVVRKLATGLGVKASRILEALEEAV